MNLKEIRASLTKMLFKLEEVTAEDGSVLLFDGEVIVEGMEVNTHDINGEIVKANGEYIVGEDVITIENGVVISIKSKVEVVELEEVVATPTMEDFNALAELVKALVIEVQALKDLQDKTNETVIEMSKQEMGKVIKNKPTEINKKNSGENPAMKYFK